MQANLKAHIHKCVLKTKLFYVVLACILSAQLKAAWCLTSSTYNAGVVVPPNIASSSAYTMSVASGTKSAKIVYWSFVATSGVTYHFDLCQSSTTDDTMLFLYNGPSGSGALQTSNDDYVPSAAPVSGMAMTKSGIDWTCGSNGTYYVVAMNYGSPCGVVFTNNGNLILSCYYNYNTNCSSTRALPFAENFDSWGSCWTSSLSLTSGSGTSNTAWTVWPSNDAGGTAPEAVLAGNQACSGCVETSTYKLTQPLNTFSVTSMQLSFKHSLYTTSGTASGAVTGTLYLETSSDGTNWTSRWTQAYSGNAASSALQTIYNQQSVTTSPFNPNSGNPSYSNLTYVRFRVVGVLFKIYQWHVDQGAMTPLTTLPVELLNFTAERAGSKEVELKWATATEKNNSYFIVERSLDGNNFEEIQTVKGAGNSKSIVNYNTIDANPNYGINYYRLKLTGEDNMPTYSKVTYVEFFGAKVKFEDPYPNPTSGEIMFDLYTPIKGILNIQIIDYTGRIIKEENNKIEEGRMTSNINFEDLAQGVYYIKATFDKTGDQAIKKIIRN